MNDCRIDPAGVRPSDTDGDVFTTTGGVAGWGAPALPSGQLLPLTTAVGGAPELVWDDNDEIVMMEVTL